MNKEFIPYEQALTLKELGFDESCLNFYFRGEALIEMKATHTFKEDSECVKAPLYQQAFRWFRDKYNLIPDIQYYGNWNFEIFRIGEFAEPMDDVNVDYTFKGGTYEEAELESLNKLIEIVKSK